ncbi:hypothetical protein ACHAWF_006609, partial [Thalassiosira exigua]
MIEIMNKHVACFLFHYIKEAGGDAEFFKEIMRNSCESELVHQIHQCEWDPKKKELITPKDREESNRRETLTEAAWFRDVIGELGKNNGATGGDKKAYADPEELFNLDRERSMATLYQANDGVYGKTEGDDIIDLSGRGREVKGKGDAGADDDASSRGSTGSGDASLAGMSRKALLEVVQGERIAVCLDANQDVYKKELGKALTDPDGLAMNEAVGFHTGKKLEATFFRGTKAINAVWSTEDLENVQACTMPVGYGLVKAHRDAPSSKLAQDEVNRLDKLSEDLMKNAERRCRKIKNGRIPFSPESSVWIRRCQVYRSLLKFKAGKFQNRGNLKRAARRCKIRGGLALSVKELRRRLKFCKEKCDYFRQHGKRYRQRHLQRCLKRSQERADEEGEKKILQIIQREKDKAFWRRLNFILGKHKRSRGVDSVQVEREDGLVKEYTERADVQRAIWSEVHEKRFYLAEKAPICKGNLRGRFGYRAATPAAKAVLAGTYDYETNAVDQATRDLLEERARIRQI